jgi:prolyl-tRNA editing enzyme YbaK/EbsC (Cys-tRNA(Pro) deacylase)
MPNTSLLNILILLAWLHHLPASVAGLLHSQRGPKILLLDRVRTLAPTHLSEAKPITADGRSGETSVFDNREAVAPIVSPYAALEKFLSACADQNKKLPGSIQIVPQGSTKLPPCQEVESHVFTAGGDVCIIAVAAAGRAVDNSKVQAALSTEVDSPGQDEVPSLCGFPTGNIPPIGHSSSKNITILVDSNLLEKCTTEEIMLLYGGGHAYWRSLVSPKVLLSDAKVQIASISDTNSIENASVRPTASLLSTFPSSDAMNPIPLEAVEAPPIHIAEIVMQQRELSNPLTPSLVSVTGRVGKIESRRKQLVSCELLPLNVDENVKADNMPWKSRDGIDMAVTLIVGKKILQQLGKIQGVAAIEGLEGGMDIQVQAKTKVGDRGSLGKWVETRTLELDVFDYQILTGDTPNGEAPSGSKGYKHRPPGNMVAKSPGMPELTMNDVFSEGSVHFVDDMESLRKFARAYQTMLSQLVGSGSVDSDGSRDTKSCSNLIGIDCEWQPRQFMEAGQPQPVLLMQVSLHALEKVYLFDFQTMLRPLVPKETPMNRLEHALCETLDDMFSSTIIFKTGYQLSSDLRRIATSYQHIPCFQEVHSVLEVSGLIKRILHITKQKKSRMITMSLARMTEHYVGRTVNKECQVSNWSERPMKSEQLEYAALDAAISPKLVEKVLESIDASIDMSIPMLKRWDGDENLSKLIESWRFMFLETEDDTRIQEVQAKQIVGPSWVVSQNWITGGAEPERVACE